MKRKNTIWSLVLALVMVLGVFAPLSTLAAEDEKTETVTIHKILMKKDKFKDFPVGKDGADGSKYDGNKIAQPKKFFGDDELQDIGGVYFVVKNAAGQYIKPDGGTTTQESAALKGFTTEKTGLVLDTSNLKPGEYVIEEDQSKSKPVGEDGQPLKGDLTDMKAVPIKITLPLVNSEGVVKHAHVYPKNTSNEPNVNKNFDKDGNAVEPVKEVELIGDVKNLDVDPTKGADPKPTLSRKIGDKVPFKVVTTVPEKAKYQVFEWSDNMVEGLKYNRDVKIQLNGNDLAAGDYTKSETDNGFEIKLTAAGLAKVTNQDSEQTFTIKYSATIKGDLTPDKEVPNKLVLTYGNNPNDKKKKEPTPPKVVTGGKKFVKTEWKEPGTEGIKRLGGAEFYVKNDKNEYLLETGTGAEKAYSWGAKGSPNVVVLKSAETTGKFEITGLAYGNYTLEEKTAPKNYAKITTPIPFTIEKDSYTKEANGISYNGDSTIDAKQVKNKEIIIPQTGGMGTMIFMVVGMALMGGAFIAMRKRGAEQA